MENIHGGTGINYFAPGQSLSSQTMNNLNSAINANTRVTNSHLLECINPNVEEKNFNKTYTLESLLPLVPKERRVSGIKLRFLSSDGWKEYIFTSTTPSEHWTDLRYWVCGDQASIIDGGEW
jgi:hypothetical protein